MTRPRDSQRARLYRAEGEVDCGRGLPSVERMQAYVDGLVAADWFVVRWGARSFEVRPGFGHRRAMTPATAQSLEDAFTRHRVRWTLSAVPTGRS